MAHFGDISYNVFNRRKSSYFMLETLYFIIFSRMDHSIVGHQKCKDMQSTCTSSGSTGTLHIFTFPMTYHSTDSSKCPSYDNTPCSQRLKVQNVRRQILFYIAITDWCGTYVIWLYWFTSSEMKVTIFWHDIREQSFCELVSKIVVVVFGNKSLIWLTYKDALYRTPIHLADIKLDQFYIKCLL